MKRLLSLFFILTLQFFYSQQSLSVVRAGDLQPVSGASVYCNKKLVGKTNSQGKLNISEKCRIFEVRAVGYNTDKVLSDKVMEIILTKKESNVQDIEEVVLKDKSDPRALKILDEVNQRFKQNNPLSLDSYAFKSYQKFSMDFDEDSIASYETFLQKRLDSLSSIPNRTFNQTKEKQKDSLEAINVQKLMTGSKLFLWERAQQYLFSKKLGEKVYVMDNRISGLKEPIYEMMTLRSNLNKIPKEVRNENRNLYRFFLTDSIEIDGRKNFVIRFRQVDYTTPVQKRKYNGYIYVDIDTYAIKKIESNSKIKSEGGITSIWKPIDNKWFLEKEYMKINVGYVNFSNQKPGEKTEKEKELKLKQKKFGNYVYGNSYYYDFFTNIKEDSEDFKGYTQSIENADGSLLGEYRLDSLSQREKNTYAKIDSVGKKYKLDQKVSLISNLLRGNLRLGVVDFDVTKFVKYNRYEGFRLGAAGKLNERFHRYISPDAYFAYGFRDHAWKYGAGIDIKTTLRKNSVFRIEYANDVSPSGRFNQNLWNFKMKLMNSGVDLRNDKYFAFNGFRASYEYDASNSITLKFSAKRQKQEAKFSYQYLNYSGLVKDFSTTFTMKYAPKNKNIMTPSGKYTYEYNFPEFYFNYEKGFKTFGGEFDYHRVDALFIHQFQNKLGLTGSRIYGGHFSGKAPIWNTFEMGGLDSESNGKISSRINLTTYLGFATMEAGKYFNDKFIGYQLSHRLPFHFKSFGKNTSSFDLVYKGIIGNFKNPEDHQFNFQKLDHLYQEAGLEWNNFLSTKFNLGFFYRIGYYATPQFKDNFALQIKLNSLGF